MNQATEHGIDAAGDDWHITTTDGSPRWRRTPDLEVLGPAQDSGLRDASYLVRRWDDQLLQLSELLHLTSSTSSRPDRPRRSPSWSVPPTAAP